MEKRLRNIIKILFFILCMYNFCNANESQKLTITGQVVDYMARPVKDAEIAVYQELYNYDTRQEYAKDIYQLKNTDANGCFAIDVHVLPIIKPVFIVARKEGLALGWDIFLPSECYKDKIIILEKPFILEGSLVDEKGQPAAEAKVQAVPKNTYLRRLEQSPVIEPKQWFSTKTDSNGKFSFNNFSADVSADFWIDAPGKLITYQYTPNFMSAWGYEVGQKDIQLVLPREIKVHGKVIDAESKNPIKNTKMYFHPEDITQHNNTYYPEEIIPDSNGSFSFKGLPPGNNYVEIFFNDESQWVTKRIKFEINPDDMEKEVLIEVNKGGLAEITILEASTKKPVTGINAYFHKSVKNENSGFYKNAFSEKDGIIRVWAPEGECKFTIFSDGYSPSIIENEHITITKGQIAKREILLDHARQISGIVTDENGKPATGVLVMGNPTGGVDYTDKEGKFKVTLEPERPCERLIACDTKHNLAAITEIGDISKPVHITLNTALSIKGKVTDPNGIAIPAARIGLTLRASNYISPLTDEIITDSKGQYCFSAVPQISEDFEYRISTYSSGFGTLEYKSIQMDKMSETMATLSTTVLQPANQSLSGFVVDSNNIPAPGVLIMMNGKGQPIRNSITDKDGYFTLHRICNGPLRIQVGLGNTNIDSGFINADEIEENIKIILGQNLTYTKNISLTGKQLPDFNDVIINQSALNSIDKKLLVCFFDIEQRPSRNCILELSKKAKELTEKDIEIIAVQISQIEQANLDDWIKENQITFPVGMIKENEEQTKFNWGVKALPWLILTNKEHVVQAEGFSIAELDNKTKAIE